MLEIPPNFQAADLLSGRQAALQRSISTRHRDDLQAAGTVYIQQIIAQRSPLTGRLE